MEFIFTHEIKSCGILSNNRDKRGVKKGLKRTEGGHTDALKAKSPCYAVEVSFS